MLNMRSKAWLAARVSQRLARLPRTVSHCKQCRLRSTRAAAPVLLAHAEVTIKHFFNGSLLLRVYCLKRSNSQESAYRTLCQHNTDVSIVICGESGSGKTETTKHVLKFLSNVASATERKHPTVSLMLLRYNAASVELCCMRWVWLHDILSHLLALSLLLAAVSHIMASVVYSLLNVCCCICMHILACMRASDDEVASRIMDSNPLMEAFGNAKTVRNDNSRYALLFTCVCVIGCSDA